MRPGYDKKTTEFFNLVERKVISMAPLPELEDLCNKLINIGKEKGDEYLLGCGYFFLERAYFEHNEDELMLKAHTYTVPYLMAAEEYKFLSRSYNNIGVISVSRNNYSNAFENYLLALNICKDHKLKYNEGITYCNIGEMYRTNGSYRDAINFYKKALALCEDVPTDTPFYYSNLILIHSALLFCYTKRKDYENARRHLTLLVGYEPNAEDDYHILSELCAKFRFFYDTGANPDPADYVPEILDQLKRLNSLHDFFPYLIDLCDALYVSEKYEYTIQLAHTLEERMGKYEGNSPYIKMWIENYKIKYYKSKDNEKHYRRALKNYFAALEERNNYIKKFNQGIIDAQIKNIELTEKFRKTVESIEKLKVNAEHDALTGLYNYGYIKDLLENLFIEAAAKNECLGVAIIDIDFFKQYNDTYGHQQGDKAIKAVADVLASVANEDVIPSRYGGDEFIIVFRNMSDDVLIDICNKIRRSIDELKIKHEGSLTSDYLTVSVGARNSIPHKVNKSWDYLYAADMALYDVKEFKKGGFQLVHRYLTPKSKAGNKENKLTIM